MNMFRNPVCIEEETKSFLNIPNFSSFANQIYLITILKRYLHRKNLTCGDCNTFLMRIPSWWFRTKTNGFMVDRSTESVVCTTSSYTWIFASVFITNFINWTMGVFLTFAATAFPCIAKVVWFAHAFTDIICVNVIICVGTTWIRITWIFWINGFFIYS